MHTEAPPQQQLIPSLKIARVWQHARSECGSTMIETALSLIILLTFIFGVMETSLAFYSYHFLSEAAREGTRYAIVRGSSCTPVASGCPASPTDIQNYVKNLGFPGINPANMTVSSPTYSAYPAGGVCTPSAACNNPGDLVTVTVTYSFPLAVPFVPAQTYTMSSSSAMVISQ